MDPAPTQIRPLELTRPARTLRVADTDTHTPHSARRTPTRPLTRSTMTDRVRQVRVRVRERELAEVREGREEGDVGVCRTR